MAKNKTEKPVTSPENGKKKKKGKKKKSKFARFVGRFFLVMLICIMLVGVTGALVAFDVLKDVGLIHIGSANPEKQIPGVDYIDLDQYIANQDQTTIIYAKNADLKYEELARLHGAENRIWIELDKVNDYMKNAVVALEDKRFYEHQGVDWIRTVGVVVEYHFSQGGSTLTQQLIKNLTGENGRTLIRKYNEIKSALALEQHYSKDDILEAYLNTIYLDAGCYGVKTAAEYYFGTTPDKLTLAQSAILASITCAPRAYNPIINYDTNIGRAKTCLANMLDQGYCTEKEYKNAVRQLDNHEIEFVGYKAKDDTDTITDEDGNEIEVEVADDNEIWSYYVDYIINSAIEDFQSTYGYTYSEAFKKVFYGGLKIYAAVDLSVQAEMEDVYYNRITFPNEVDTEENPAIQSAMAITDYDGRLVGIVGRLGPKTTNRALDIASDSPRQPGSTIKPLSCYCPAIELNYYTWSSLIPNYGININGDVWPTNYGGVSGSVSDLRTLDTAIAPSLNTVPARIIQTLGTTTSYNFLRDKFHISTLLESDDNYAPLAIGAMGNGITCLEFCAAYATFGNGGKYIKPWAYYKITNNAGETLIEPDKEGEQVISEATASVMNRLCQTVFTYSNGTGTRFALSGYTIYGKSGTTSDNKDKWIVGATPYYICTAWVGFEQPKAINTSYYGSNPAGTVWKEVMSRIHRNLDSDDKEFTYSEDCVKKAYCRYSGKLATSSCYSVGYGYYKADNLPGYCSSCGGYSYSGSSGSSGGSVYGD